MQRALLAGLAVAVIAPFIGSFLVARKQSLFADTLAHVSLLGVAVGIATGGFPLLTAVFVSALGATGMALLYVRKRVLPDAVLVLFLYGSLGAAIVIMGFTQSYNAGFLSVLFGSLLTVSAQELWLIGGLGIAAITILTLFWKELAFVSFDEEVARVAGLPVTALTILLLVLAGVVVSLSIRVVGALLIGALMVIPVIAAMQFGQSFKRTVFVAIGFSLASVLAGLALSYNIGSASGGTIVLVALLIFLISYGVNRKPW